MVFHLSSVMLEVLFQKSPSSSLYHLFSRFISEGGSGLYSYFIDVEADVQSKENEPLARKYIFSKAGCKPLMKSPRSCSQAQKYLLPFVWLLLGLSGQENIMLHFGAFVTMNIMYYSNCFITFKDWAFNKTQHSENCLLSLLFILSEAVDQVSMGDSLSTQVLLSFPINCFSFLSVFNNEIRMKNNRIKKHSHTQIQQSSEYVVSLCLTYKQKSCIMPCLWMHFQTWQQGAQICPLGAELEKHHSIHLLLQAMNKMLDLCKFIIYSVVLS